MKNKLDSCRRPSISVCLLFFEKVNQTLECIQGFLPSNIPIYLLDNGSSYESSKEMINYIKNYPQVKYKKNSKNLGISKGRNELIKKTKEDWLFFIDNDISIKTIGWIEQFYKETSLDKEAEVLIPKLFNVHLGCYTDYNKYEKQNNYLTNTYNVRSKNKYNNLFPGGASIIKASVFKKRGFYDENYFVGFEDLDFAFNALVNNKPIKAKVINTIELWHDHRPTKNINEVLAAKTRYKDKTLEESYLYLCKKFNLPKKKYSNSWADGEFSFLTKPNLNELIKYKIRSKIYTLNHYFKHFS